MEHSHKNTDCYFFYYSTCKKGDNCPFRHEPSALGCETMCLYWQQGHCLNEHCNFRHMELKKNRKSIPCYWETQPSGCRKPHCSFYHKNARTITSDPINPVKTSDITTKPLNQELNLNRQDDTKYDGSSTESDQGRGSSEAGSFIGSPAVDPLIVKFEEESDNESVPSPVKPQPQPKVPYCKTYEEIRLEEIQAESAAYYSYEADDYQVDVGGGKVRRIASSRDSRKVCLYQRLPKEKRTEDQNKELNFEVLSLEEIRRRKRRKAMLEGGGDGGDRDSAARTTTTTTMAATTNVEVVGNEEESAGSFLKDAIKTLAELRAATAAKGVKRSIEECLANDPSETETRRVRCKTTDGSSSNAGGKVPPVRLRRSPKRLLVGLASVLTEDQNLDVPEETPKERHDRLSGDEAQPEESPSGVNRKHDVEIRLCDSSTDEDQSAVTATTKTTGKAIEEKKSVGTDTTDDSKIPHLSCDSLLNINEDEYLMLDAASDDILKDIDALLKDKPAC